ncbi:integrase [Methylotuvimicrobium buryatense]|uniref:Integrase n=1 Tax=Methylotuvimicrobium buryatense TaxID=95641 RepID=A0A4P9UYE1_METBY|nr:integrase [Methylotuvimicrobium buryatense]
MGETAQTGNCWYLGIEVDEALEISEQTEI